MNKILFGFRCSFVMLGVALLCQWQPAFSKSGTAENVTLKCDDPVGNNNRLENFLQGNSEEVIIKLEAAKWPDCSILLHHAQPVLPSVSFTGFGASGDEIPNARFFSWPNQEIYAYVPPTLGDPRTYSGTGGVKIPHANCWVSNVWGLYGNGYIIKKFSERQPYLNWRAISIEPRKNQCNGERTKCVDDPDATGFHHVPDVPAKKFMREGTAGHDISQLVPISQFYSGWVTVRVRLKLNSGNNKFYVRIIQGVGTEKQLNRAFSHTLPGIKLEGNGRFMDYLMITNLDQQSQELGGLPNTYLKKEKFMQIVLTSAIPQLGHDIDVARISLYRGINAPRNSVFNSPDALVSRRGHACSR